MAADVAEVGSIARVVPLPDHGVQLVTADTIVRRDVRWLWHDFLAAGKLQLLAGPVGTGKTAIALEFAAIITTGGMWPDGTQASQGNVLVYAGEDDLADTVVPRLAAAGADLSRVVLVSGFRDKEGLRRFDPSRDTKALREKLNTMQGIALVVIDPVISLVKGSSNDSLDVRRSLEVLLEIADETGAAILGLTHFNKGIANQDLIDRVMGSQAFAALARIVLIAVKVGNGDDRLLARSKSNLGPDGGGVLYQIVPKANVAAVEWIRVVEGDARDLMRSHADDPPSRVREAEVWLTDFLREGPKAAEDVLSQGAAAGHASRTLRRAKDQLDIASSRAGKGWVWRLPAGLGEQDDQLGQQSQDGQQSQVGSSTEAGQSAYGSALGHLGNLGHLDTARQRVVLTDWAADGKSVPCTENLTKIS